MAQNASGDTVVVAKRVLNSNAPIIVRTNDSTLKTFLDGLVAADGAYVSDLLSTADSQALWAARVLDTDSNIPAGSSYVVSNEVAKRIEAGRY